LWWKDKWIFFDILKFWFLIERQMGKVNKINKPYVQILCINKFWKSAHWNSMYDKKRQMGKEKCTMYFQFYTKSIAYLPLVPFLGHHFLHRVPKMLWISSYITLPWGLPCVNACSSCSTSFLDTLGQQDVVQDVTTNKLGRNVTMRSDLTKSKWNVYFNISKTLSTVHPPHLSL